MKATTAITTIPIMLNKRIFLSSDFFLTGFNGLTGGTTIGVFDLGVTTQTLACSFFEYSLHIDSCYNQIL
jgi:hypothetical protein